MSKVNNFENAKVIFNKLGLSNIQFDIYISLLKIAKPIGANEISKIVNIPRTSVYHNVRELTRYGLILQYVEGRSKKYKSEDPLVIQSIIDNEIEKIKNQRERFEIISSKLPMLISELNEVNKLKGTQDTTVEFYEGKSAVTNIHSLSVNSKEIRAYVNGADVVKYFPGNNFQKFTEAARSGSVEIWDLHVDTEITRKFIQEVKLPASYHIKLLPKDTIINTMDYLIFDNSVAIIEVQQKFTVIHIKSHTIYENAREIHKLLWDLLPDPNLS